MMMITNEIMTITCTNQIMMITLLTSTFSVGIGERFPNKLILCGT